MRRAKTSERGYGSAHQRERKRWAQAVEMGGVCCSRCGRPIEPATRWHLDHSDDRGGYRGPSHAYCNTVAANRRRGRTARVIVAPARDW